MFHGPDIFLEGTNTITLITLAAAACLIASTATASFAASVDFNFSFTEGTNTITGLIEGLESDGLDQMASLITVRGVKGEFVFDTSVVGVQFFRNTVDVTGGVIDLESLIIFARGNVNVAGFSGALTLFGAEPRFAFGESQLAPNNLITKGSREVNFEAISAVPLPAGGLLLLSAFGGFAALKRRHKGAA